MPFDLRDMGVSTQTIVTNFKANWISIAIVVFIIITLLVIIKLVSKRLRIIIEKKISEEKIEIKKRTYTFNSVLSNLIIVLNQWTIERQLRKRIKDKFDEVGIEIPYPCRNAYMRS